MNKKIEAYKMQFAKALQDSDYKFIHTYDRIETCIEAICISDLIPRNNKFKFFKFIESERILIKTNNRFLIEYCIKQNETTFELYELLLSKYNEFESSLNELD